MLGDRAKDRSTPNRYVPAPIRNVRFTSTPAVSCAQIAVIPHGVANATDIPIGDGQIDEESGSAGVENRHVFSARLVAERAGEPTLAQAARPVRSRLRRSAIQSQAASLRKSGRSSRRGI